MAKCYLLSASLWINNVLIRLFGIVKRAIIRVQRWYKIFTIESVVMIFRNAKKLHIVFRYFCIISAITMPGHLNVFFFILTRFNFNEIQFLAANHVHHYYTKTLTWVSEDALDLGRPNGFSLKFLWHQRRRWWRFRCNRVVSHPYGPQRL